MANVTFLSWNIETFGPKASIDMKTYQISVIFKPMLNIIAETVRVSGANLVSILEVSSSVANVIGYLLKRAIAFKTQANTWDWTTIPTAKVDTYLVLWNTAGGFAPVANGVVRANIGSPFEAYRGLVAQDINGAVLRFHKSLGGGGGRKPGFVLFQTTDRAPNAEVYFTALTYHAQFNPSQFANNNGGIGVRSIAAGREVTQAATAGGNVVVTSSLISGDFNINLVDPNLANFPGGNPYTPLAGVGTASVTAAGGDAAKSSLIENPPLNGWGYNNTLNYRASAYDNIFCRAVAAGPNNNGIIDMLSQIGSWNGALGGLRVATYKFDTETIINGDRIKDIPPQTRDEAYYIYRAVSNHLPVVATVQI